MADTQSIRPFLDQLRAAGALLQIDAPVDPEFELSAFLSAADTGPALLFGAVKGAALRVAGNLLSNRARIAASLGVTRAEIIPRIHAAIRTPIAPARVEQGAVHEVIELNAPLAGLPIPRFFEREEKKYITAAVIIVRDPDTGAGNASFARFAVQDERTAMIGIAPNHHLAQLSRRAAARGQKLEFAAVIGAHPAIQLAACLYLGLGDDELACAGALLGAPVRVVQAKTVDLLVPAEAELILEGSIDCESPIDEGFVSEYHGMYQNYGPGWRASFTARTQRHDAIFQVIEPGHHGEHIFLGALPIAAGLLHAIAAAVPNVKDVAVTPAGGGRTDIVVSLDAPRPGQARRAMFAAWAAVTLVKRITVVDGDIDPWDAAAVDWARMNRTRFERDFLLVPQAGTDRSEPLGQAGLVTKLGIDATAKSADRAEGTERALPPRSARDTAHAWFTKNLAPADRSWLEP